jgi:hypothetical protein
MGIRPAFRSGAILAAVLSTTILGPIVSSHDGSDVPAPTRGVPRWITQGDVAELGRYRAPNVLSIAPDTIDCDNPDDPDGVEDVQIAGTCFLGRITGAFLATNPDGTGTRVDLSNVVHTGRNEITATVPVEQLEADTPYYVFVVRDDSADGAGDKRSTDYPNALGYDVTFSCVSGGVGRSPVITKARAARDGHGRLVLKITGSGFVPGPGGAVVLINGVTCKQQKMAAGGDRIRAWGGIDQLLPGTVAVRNPDGSMSNGVYVDLEE